MASVAPSAMCANDRARVVFFAKSNLAVVKQLVRARKITNAQRRAREREARLLRPEVILAGRTNPVCQHLLQPFGGCAMPAAAHLHTPDIERRVHA